MNQSKNDDPVAMITGSAQRIGAIIARTLHQSGYRIIIHYHHSEDQANELCQSLNQIRSNSAHMICADLNEFAAYSQLIHRSVMKWERLDVLINNASSFFATPIHHTLEADWNDLINTNLKAPYFLSQAAAPYLTQKNGCIINIADIHGLRPLRGYPVYSIAKAGMLMLTQSLALELAPHIRVNAIAPGVTLLPKAKVDDQALVQKLTEKTALKRFSDPEDIANAVIFFINNHSITGQTLNIDCGRSLKQ